MNLENTFARHGLRLLFNCIFGKSSAKSLNLFYLNRQFKLIEDENLVFIFQGPMIFPVSLYKGLSVYRQIFPKAQIILSTWNKEDVDIEYLRSLNVDFVFPLPPDSLGVLGVNRQIVGVSAAVNSIYSSRKNENTNVFKFRTDYFPRKPYDLYRLLKAFQKIFGRHRIWGVDINTKMNIPFSFSDIMNCGSYEKMRLYWAGDFLGQSNVDRIDFFRSTDNGQNIEKIIKYGTPETYLATNYLKRLGYSPNLNSLKEYHALLGKEFGIIDADQIGLAFDKYSVLKAGCSPVSSIASEPVSFVDWISMVSHDE
jgi:hypothetical protein